MITQRNGRTFATNLWGHTNLVQPFQPAKTLPLAPARLTMRIGAGGIASESVNQAPRPSTFLWTVT